MLQIAIVRRNKCTAPTSGILTVAETGYICHGLVLDMSDLAPTQQSKRDASVVKRKRRWFELEKLAQQTEA